MFKLVQTLFSVMFSLVLGFFFVLILLKIIWCKCVDCKGDFDEKGGLAYYVLVLKQKLLEQKIILLLSAFYQRSLSKVLFSKDDSVY